MSRKKEDMKKEMRFSKLRLDDSADEAEGPDASIEGEGEKASLDYQEVEQEGRQHDPRRAVQSYDPKLKAFNPNYSVKAVPFFPDEKTKLIHMLDEQRTFTGLDAKYKEVSAALKRAYIERNVSKKAEKTDKAFFKLKLLFDGVKENAHPGNPKGFGKAVEKFRKQVDKCGSLFQELYADPLLIKQLSKQKEANLADPQKYRPISPKGAHRRK